MVDFRTVGSTGLIIQYEDIISLVGYNIITYLKSRGINNAKVEGMSDKDILLAYVNRTEPDISKWIKDTFNIDCSTEYFADSEMAFKPNNLYAYKVFSTAYKEKHSTLMIYSEFKSPVIEKYIESFNVPTLQYVHGDIVNILDKNPNITIMTTMPATLEMCKKSKAPFMIVLADDFMYVNPKLQDELSGTNKIGMYTSIMSSD